MARSEGGARLALALVRRRIAFKKLAFAHALNFCFLALALAILALAAALDASVALFRLSSAVMALARARPPCLANSERIFLMSSSSMTGNRTPC